MTEPNWTKRLFWLIFTIFASFILLTVSSILLASGRPFLLLGGIFAAFVLISTYLADRRSRTS